MADARTPASPDRLRTAPADRFSGASHRFDLHAALQHLRAETHPALRARRLAALLQRGDAPLQFGDLGR